jgi:hypothetical protein
VLSVLLLAGAAAVAERVFAATSVAGGRRWGADSSAFAQRFGGFLNNTPYDGRFVFVRMYYAPDLGVALGGRCAMGGFSRNPLWAHDYPTGERNFMRILTAVTNVPAHTETSSVLDFGDPEMFKFPVIYLVEPGCWSPSEEQVTALRSYLDKGGFMIVDDFPFWAWDNFAFHMARAFPDRQWQDLDVTHPIFNAFFEIHTLDIVPAYPELGPHPIFRAMFEDNDPGKRMQVMVNYQNDLSEFWEFSEQGAYPIDETNEAYKVGVNEFIYGMTH